MDAFVDMMKAVFLIFMAITIIVAGSVVGTFIIPVLIIAFLIYTVYLVINDERNR